jgi:predicted O-linked N-acetylglucosamine transferase (SPINDLY family)
MQITALKEKLADAERATRDVLRGVEVDMANVTVCEHHNTTVRARVEKQQQVEDAHVNLSNKRTLQKVADLLI